MSALGSRSQRAPSPSYTTYSGISNYRSEPYRSTGQAPAIPTLDSRKIAKIHFDELQVFLGQHLAKEPLNSRTNAREKLTRLSKRQFQELSTDVYDELVRRNNNIVRNEVPFLTVRDDFHPKRNQARQKLATLPNTRFKDLASDTCFEIGRRYPEFKEPETSPLFESEGTPHPIHIPFASYAWPGSNYGDAPSPDYRDLPPIPPPAPYSPGPNSRRKHAWGQNSLFPTAPVDRRRPSQDQNNDFYAPPERRRPSEETLHSTVRATPSGRPPSGDNSASTSKSGPATSGVVIPNKSTIAEEDIEVPFEREDDVRGIRASSSTAGEDNDRDRDIDEDRGTEDGASAGFKSPVTASAGLGGLSALFANAVVQPSSTVDAQGPLLKDPFSRNSKLCLDGRIIRHGTHSAAGGGYADVWEGHLEGEHVAVKILRQFSDTGKVMEGKKLLRRLWREYLAWSHLSHPNVLECRGFTYDFSMDSHKLPSLISPWMSNGTMLTYLEAHPNTDRRFLIDGVAEGLCYLHTRDPPIVHGDIRAGNILISNTGVPCLSDFGLSRTLGEIRGMTTSSEVAGSLRWMSPELLHDDQGVTIHSDVWAFGMTVLEILSGDRPYSTIKNDVLVFGRLIKGITPSRPEGSSQFSDHLWGVCRQCWSSAPAERPVMHVVRSQLTQRMH